MSTQPIGGLHTPKWTLGDHLRKVRRDARLTQAAFAALLEMNPDTYAAWETDRNEPPQSQATAVAKRIELLLRVPAEWTLGLRDDDGPHPGASRDEGLVGQRARRDSNPQPSDQEPAHLFDDSTLADVLPFPPVTRPIDLDAARARRRVS